MEPKDAKHRPHAIHTGEVPKNPITEGPEGITVSLDRWGPVTNLFTSMFDALQSNWGEHPSRTVFAPAQYATDDRVTGHMATETGWTKLTSDQRDYVESCFAGKTLQQPLEGLTFDFCIDGVARVFTHQNVRTRLGAGFMQHGGRDNDWRHRAWTMPETMRRMCVVNDQRGGEYTEEAAQADAEGLKHCISNWGPINDYIADQRGDSWRIRRAIEDHIANCRKIYAAMVDAGIPWQDARRLLPMGMQTYIHDQYNFLALQGVLANRLEHIMDWEFNCVAQLMLREVRMKCPPIISKYLGSHSDRAHRAMFAGLESWPPDGKYPNPYERCAVTGCGHAKDNHLWSIDAGGRWLSCEVCDREGRGAEAVHEYTPVDSLPRQHRPEQMPFFVLHPESMKGGPIRWIKTNGQYPHEEIKRIVQQMQV